jgi:predicted acyl esterase
MSAKEDTRETIRVQAAGFAILFSLLLLVPVPVRAQTYSVTVEHNAIAAMRDGAKLRADIISADSRGKVPCALSAHAI